MRLKAPIAVSALVVAGLVTAGSSSVGLHSGPDPNTPAPLLAAASAGIVDGSTSPGVPLTGTVGLVPSTPKPARKLRAATPGLPAFAGGTTLRDVAIPSLLGGLGIPEIVLAAYRNAELALAASEPNCGLSWNLLAGIGHIESGHAGGGRTDPAGTTLSPVLGPVLDGSLAGNEVIKAADGSFVRAIGPMQFLPNTWRNYASDGNADGVADPNNVFDAALGAGKYLCSGGLNLRDPAQELRSVLRYNNSMAYAANVLSWSAAYRTGGTPSTVSISSDLIEPGSIDAAALAAETTTTTTTPSTTPTTPAAPTEQMIIIPGLPPIPCGIFCPPPPPTVPAQPVPGQPVPGQPAAPGQPPAANLAPQPGQAPGPAAAPPGPQPQPAPLPGPPPTPTAAPPPALPPPPPCFIFCPPPPA